MLALRTYPSVIYVFFLFSIAFSLAHYQDNDSVLVLSNGNFDATLRSYQYIMVEFYSPWSRECETITNQYANAAKTLQEEGSSVKLAKVDATTEKELARKFMIRSYPTFKYFIEGRPHDYTGGRTKYDILDWARDLTLPSTTFIENIQQFEQVLNENRIVVVYWGSNTTFEYKTFSLVASEFPDIEFVYVDSPEVMEKYPIVDNAKITMFKSFDHPRTEYTGYIHKERLGKFIKENRNPRILEFEPKHAQRLFHGELPTIMLIHSDNEESKIAFECLPAVADYLEESILVTTVGEYNEWRPKLLKELGAEGRDLPLLAIIKPAPENPIKYVYEFSGIEGDTILQFYHEFSENKLTAYYKSEPVPQSQEGSVVKLVGKTYKKIVSDKTKDVLVLFYNSWDKSQNQLLKIWNELGEKAKEIEDLEVAKIDLFFNEAEGLSAESMPSLALFMKESKSNPQKYLGIKSVESIWEWVKSKVIPETEKEEITDSNAESEGLAQEDRDLVEEANVLTKEEKTEVQGETNKTSSQEENKEEEPQKQQTESKEQEESMQKEETKKETKEEKDVVTEEEEEKRNIREDLKRDIPQGEELRKEQEFKRPEEPEKVEELQPKIEHSLDEAEHEKVTEKGDNTNEEDKLDEPKKEEDSREKAEVHVQNFNEEAKVSEQKSRENVEKRNELQKEETEHEKNHKIEEKSNEQETNEYTKLQSVTEPELQKSEENTDQKESDKSEQQSMLNTLGSQKDEENIKTEKQEFQRRESHDIEDNKEEENRKPEDLEKKDEPTEEKKSNKEESTQKTKTRLENQDL